MKRLVVMVSLFCAMQIMHAQTYFQGMHAGEGWDIYVAGNYRYGPSIIINDDNSIDAWFAAPGGQYGSNIYSGTQSKEFVSGSAAEVFTVPTDFYSVALHCYAVGSAEHFTLKMYKYQNSYEESMQQSPLYTHTYTLTSGNWVFGLYNEAAENDLSVRFPAGTYIIEVTDATENAGFYNRTSSNSTYNVSRYSNNVKTGLHMELRLLESKAWSYWDVATYQHSVDGGKTWSTEQTSLAPTIGSRDEYSVCDPAVVKWGEYYYMGYTSTENLGGVDNHLYMARGKSPMGPWEKWNGTSWGGNNVQPIVTYTGNPAHWGVGEPSMIIKDGTIYVYYSWDEATVTTRLMTADINDPLWPAHMTPHGTVIDKRYIGGSDHCDVKYCDSLKTFYALHTSNRMAVGAYISVWTSTDGIHFDYKGVLQGADRDGLHNCGFSGDAQGHVDLNKPQYVSYAYGVTSWGKWNTWFQPLAYSFPLDLSLTTMADHSKASGNMDAGFPSTAAADGSTYKTAYQATAVDGTIYAADNNTGSFLSFPCLKIKDGVDYSGKVSGVNSYGITSDDAANLILRSDNNSATPSELVLYNHAQPEEHVTINFTLKYNGATSYISAMGDVFSEQGGYVYFFPKGQKYVCAVKIQQGALAEVVNYGPLSIASADGYVIPTQRPDYFFYQLRTKGIYEYKGEDKGLKLAYTSIVAPDLNNTAGGAYVSLDGHDLLIYPSGTAYSGGFSVKDLSVHDMVATSAPALGKASMSSNRAMSQSISVEKVNEHTALVYTYAMSTGYAVYALSTEKDPLTGVSSVNVQPLNINGIYNLKGQPLHDVPQSGIYIQNGKVIKK